MTNIMAILNTASNPDSSGALVVGIAVEVVVGLGPAVVDNDVAVGITVGVVVGFGVCVGVSLVIDDSGGLQTLQGWYPAAIASSGVSK
jgi:hypothetical protein